MGWIRIAGMTAERMSMEVLDKIYATACFLLPTTRVTNRGRQQCSQWYGVSHDAATTGCAKLLGVRSTERYKGPASALDMQCDCKS